MAAFQVFLYGRFWVFTEARLDQRSGCIRWKRQQYGSKNKQQSRSDHQQPWSANPDQQFRHRTEKLFASQLGRDFCFGLYIDAVSR